MAYILVNKGSGTIYYAQITQTGAIKKVKNRSVATVFLTQYDADKAKHDHKKKLKSFQRECVEVKTQNSNSVQEEAIIKEDQTVIEKVSEQTNTCKRKSISKTVRTQIYNEAEGRCAICGDFVPFDEFTVDHIFPVAKGGTNEISNLQCTCDECNQMKRAMSEQEFRHKIGKIFRKQLFSRIRKK